MLDLSVPLLPPKIDYKNIPQKDWRNTVPNLKVETVSNNQILLQEALTKLSPTRAETNSDQENAILGENHIVLEGKIGEGSFSKVNVATHTLTGSKLAVKCTCKKSIMNRPNLSVHILKELCLLGSLNHPNVCPLYQVIDSPSTIFMIMEYEANSDLFDLVAKRRGLPDKEAVILYRQIVSGVHYCHSQNIVHRDLKPENILLDENWNVKIADFGFADVCHDDLLEEFCGSPEYAAPEMISKTKYVGPEVDIWSLGVILFVMLTGKMPFGGTSVAKMFTAIMSATFNIPQSVSPLASDLISNILKAKAVDRLSLEKISKHPWMNMDGLSPLILQPATKFKTSIAPHIHKKLVQQGFKDAEIDDYIQNGNLGAVKTAACLLEKLYPVPIESVGEPATKESNRGKSFQIKRHQLPPKKSLMQTLKNNRESTVVVPLPYQSKERPPICAVHVHSMSWQDFHSKILRTALLRGGKIIQVEEDEPQTMLFTIPVTMNPLPTDNDFGVHHLEDQELVSCLLDLTIFDLDIQLVTQENPTSSRFYMLNGHDSDELVEVFDSLIYGLVYE